jgi:hypothetical protein
VLRFGVIAEGLTDQIVIENILLGYFQDEEPVINFVQPLPATSGPTAPPGGWTLVFESLKRGEPQKALQFNDYLVIHIDTDVQEEPGFDVPRREQGRELPIADQVDLAIVRLKQDIDATLHQARSDQILFAVAVDTIECWLLPLLYNNKKVEKTTGCLNAANSALRKANKDGLSAGETKFPRAYEKASSDYAKRKTLLERGIKNPSLALFIKQLDAVRQRLAANTPQPSQGESD